VRDAVFDDVEVEAAQHLIRRARATRGDVREHDRERGAAESQLGLGGDRHRVCAARRAAGREHDGGSGRLREKCGSQRDDGERHAHEKGAQKTHNNLHEGVGSGVAASLHPLSCANTRRHVFRRNKKGRRGERHASFIHVGLRCAGASHSGVQHATKSPATRLPRYRPSRPRKHAAPDSVPARLTLHAAMGPGQAAAHGAGFSRARAEWTGSRAAVHSAGTGSIEADIDPFDRAISRSAPKAWI